MNQPNIIFILSDQQRWDTMGCYGQALDVTPHLDQMASEGTRFEYAFTCQPVCGPARSCLQTGKYATETGCFRNHIALPLDQRTIAHHLADVGYQVAYIGKWHLASTAAYGNPAVGPEVDYMTKPIPPQRRGGYRDYWLASDVLEFTSHSYDGHMFDADMQRVDFPPDRFRVDCVTDFVLEYLQSVDKTSPFFLFLSYIEPHHQNDHDCYEGPRGSDQRFADFQPPPDLKDHDGDWRENYPDYLGCCASLDENVARIRACLDQLQIADDTIICYVSDHGSHFRTRNSEYKRACHEGCIRVPLIWQGGPFTNGSVRDELVSLIDLPPTILDLAGAEIPSSMRGRSLLDLVQRNNSDWPDEVFVQISESQIGRALRTSRWKYSVSAPAELDTNTPAADIYIEDFLYDLQQDPYEQHNLVSDPAYASVRQELAQRLIQRMLAAGEPAPTIQAKGS